LQTNTIDLKGVDKYCSKSLEMMLASLKLTITFKINKISSSHNSPASKNSYGDNHVFGKSQLIKVPF